MMPGRAPRVEILPLPIAGEIQAGDAVAEKLLAALHQEKLTLQNHDVLVVKHKIISKAEGMLVRLDTVRPSVRARAWARKNKLDARVVELALRESRRVVRQRRNVLITETHHGFVCANSGVDVSNVDGGVSVVLLPRDADNSARRLRRALRQHFAVPFAVIISDSFGRPWREGLTEVALGVAGLRPLHDYRGRRDAAGYSLHASVEAVADELACAAGLVCGKLERTPACIIRGFKYQAGAGSGRELLRSAKFDLFR